jgi:hypothetical protein
MTSMREQVISRFYTKLKTLETTQVKVYRNLDKPQKVTTGGIIILRDGSAEDPEIFLSPVTYIFEHLVTLEVMVQNPDSATRDASLDALLVSIGNIINANRTMDGLAEWVESHVPEFTEDAIEGAATVRLATVQVMIRFFTTDPLN